MPNDTAQPQTIASSQTSAPATQPSLDPNVVALEQSIRQVESGNDYSKSGSSGEYGAYQFLPGTWQQASTAAGVNVPLEQANPEQQNEVAYKTLASWKQQHPDWNLGNFASAWNAGEGNPDAYINDNVGTNALGVKFNTPQYANEVGDIYDKIKSGQYNPPTATSLSGGNSSAITTSPATASPQGTGIKGWIDNLNPWEKAGIVGGGALAIGGLSSLTGGLDLPFLGALGLGADGADIAGGAAAEGIGAEASAGEAAAGAGLPTLNPEDTTAAMDAEKAATTAQTSKPSILSRIIKGVEAVGAGTGIADTVNQFTGGNNNNGGGNQSGSTSSGASPEVPLGSGGSENKESFTPPAFTPESYQQSTKASQALVQAQQSAMGATPSGRVFAQSPEAQNGMNYNAMYGTVAGDDGNGNFTSEEADDKAEDMIDNVNSGMGDVLKSEGNSGDNVDAFLNAKSDAHAHNNPLEYDTIDKELEGLAAQHTRFSNERGQIPLHIMNELRKGHGRASRFDIKNPITPAKRAAHKAMYFALRQEIEKKTESKDLFNLAMKEEKGLIDGKKVNKKLNGKKIPIPNGLGKKVAERLANYTATAIGAKLGGPWGAVVGAVVGHGLDKTIEKKFGKNILERKDVKSAMESLAKTRPEVEQLLQETIKKYTNRQMAEKEYRVIQKDVPKEKQVQEEKEMGTYKMGKNPITGRVNLTGQHRQPGVSFYKKGAQNGNTTDKQSKRPVNNKKSQA